MTRRFSRCQVACFLWAIALAAGRPGFAAEPEAPLPLIDALRAQQWDLVETVLRQGSGVKSAAADGTTPLHWAVHYDRVDLAKRLIAAGADVNAATDLGVTPLGLSCENGSTSMVRLLLQSGASPAPAPGAVPVMMTAARVGNVEVVRALLAAHADPNVRETRRQQTPLMWAVANSHPQVVDALLRAGARVDARSTTKGTVVQRANRYAGVVSRDEGFRQRAVVEIPTGGSTPLLFAARSGDAQSARLLVEAGANVNDEAPDGTSALVRAVHSGHREVASVLLQKGAAVDAAGAGYTALHAAVLRGDLQMVSLLLDRGALVDSALSRGTPSRRYSRDYAFNAAWTGATPAWLAARFAEGDILRELLRRGANPNAATKPGDNALMAVIAAGVEFGPSASDRRERRLDPLDVANLAENRMAFEREALDIVRIAADAGVDIHAQNDVGDTAVHQAAARGFPTVIQFLVERGARINVKNARGATPLALTIPRRGVDESPWTMKAAEVLRGLGARE